VLTLVKSNFQFDQKIYTNFYLPVATSNKIGLERQSVVGHFANLCGGNAETSTSQSFKKQISQTSGSQLEPLAAVEVVGHLVEPVEGLDEGELQRIAQASRFGITSPNLTIL